MDKIILIRDAITAREDFLEASRNRRSIGYDKVRYLDRHFRTPFSNVDKYEYLLRREAVKQLEAFRVVEPINIDGIIEEREWGHIEPSEAFVMTADASESPVQSLVRVAYDSEYLYVAAWMEEPDPSVLEKDTVTSPEGMVWEDNDFEVFIDPYNSRKRYYQIGVNSLGTMFSLELNESGEVNMEWKPNVQSAVAVGEGYWSVEMRIPLRDVSDFELFGPPLPGDIWAFNAVRARNVEPRELTAWSPTFGLFGKPDYFGEVIFK